MNINEVHGDNREAQSGAKIKISNREYEIVGEFNYLGCIIIQDSTSEVEKKAELDTLKWFS